MWLIYMVHIYTEKAENLLPNSNFVELNIKIYSPAGLMGKAMRNGFLTLALLNPKLLAKRGLVDLKDVKNFPRKLKWMFVTSWASCSLFTVSLVIFGAYIKYIDKSPAI
ncbi:hypothetical protein ASD60_24375 [Pseudomonas sp. Root562]|nr:hypothetical protein ASD60_24375 [Pseudomonas sp. Root562]